MSLKSVASKLNSSYNSFTPSRSVSVTGALVESLKFNLRFRFSLLGMVASLTKSDSLYNIAQQRYVDRADVNRVKEESAFKSNVVNSVSALSRQISLLESVTEKNSAMINMIVNDLGYFKRQRKINFLTDNTLTLQNSSSFRVPISSRTVKGQIEQINTQLQELKKSGISRGGSSSGSTDAGKSTLLADIGKVAAVGGVAAYLASQVAQGAGGNKTTQQIVTALGGLIGAASIPATSKIIEFIVKQSIPVVSKIAQIGFAVSIAPKAAEVVGGSFSRMGDRFSGKPVIERNYQPNPYAPGSPEYMAYEGEIAAQKMLDDTKSTSLQMFDIALLGITGYYGAKGLSKIPVGKIKQAIKSREMRKRLAGRESFKTRMDRYKEYNAKVERYDQMRERLQTTRPTATASRRLTNLLSQRSRPRGIGGMSPRDERRMRAETRIAGRAAPSMVRRSTTAVRRVLGSKGSTVLNKMMNAISSNSLLRRIPIAAVPYIVFELGLMSSAQEDLDNDRIDYAEYKESVTGSLTRLVNTVGVGAMGAIVGATAGTFIAGPLGTFGGALVGFGGSLAASVLLSESGSDSWLAEKLFGVLFEDEKLEARMPTAGAVGAGADIESESPRGASSVTSGGAGAGSSSAVKSVRNNNPGNLRFANQRGSTGKDASGFAIFSTPEAGMVALEKQIRLDMGRGDTLYKFISEYAPAADKNNPLKYTDFVSKATGIQPGEQIPESKIPLLMAAIVQMEGGDSASNYFAGTLNGVAVGTMGGTGTALASIGNQTADQDILRYFISLGAGTTAQMMPSADSGGARATAPDSSSEAEGKADAALAAVKGTLQEVTRLAQEVKVLQQRNDLDASFPQVRPA